MAINQDGSLVGTATQKGNTVMISVGAQALPGNLGWAILQDQGGGSSDTLGGGIEYIWFDNFSMCGK